MANPARQPDTNCQGVLPAIASAATPTYTEGHAVPLSTTLDGVLRVNATLEAGGDASAANQTTMIGHLAAIETAVEGTVDVNIVSGAGSGGTAMTDDAAFTPGTTSVTPIAAMFDDVSPDSVNEGDGGVVRMSANRNLYTTLRDAAGNERGANVNASNQLSVSVDNTVTVASHAVTNAGTFAVQVTSVAAGNNNIGDVDVASIAAGDNNIGNVDIVTVPAPLSTTGGGTEAAALRVTVASDSTGVLSVDDNGSTLSIDDGAGSITVDNGGTFAVQAAQSGTWTVQPGNTANTTAWLIDARGNIAHDGADSGNPVKIGLKAETSPKGITLVSDGDRTDAYADADGLQMVKLNTSGADLIVERVSNTDGASTAFTNFSAVASTKNYITAFSVFRTDAGTTPIYIDFRDGTAGSILWSAVIPAGGGANNPPYNGPALFKTSANTALAYDVSAATTTVYISMSGYQSKV